MARSANRCRKPDSGAPGRAFASPILVASRITDSSDAADSALMSSVSLIAARGKYRFGPSRTRSSTSDVTDVRLVAPQGTLARCATVHDLPFPSIRPSRVL